MTGKRYDELFAKQARIEREMLGLSKHQELWRAREELGTESWAVEKILRKFDIIQSMRKDKAIAGLVFRDRVESWIVARNSADGSDLSRTRSCELDAVGNALNDLVLLESEIGEQGILDMVLRNFCWEDDRKRLRSFFRRVETLRLEKGRVLQRRIKQERCLPSVAGRLEKNTCRTRHCGHNVV